MRTTFGREWRRSDGRSATGWRKGKTNSVGWWKKPNWTESELFAAWLSSCLLVGGACVWHSSTFSSSLDRLSLISATGTARTSATGAWRRRAKGSLCSTSSSSRCVVKKKRKGIRNGKRYAFTAYQFTFVGLCWMVSPGSRQRQRWCHVLVVRAKWISVMDGFFFVRQDLIWEESKRLS